MAVTEALIIAVSGFSVVFLMLCILWGIIELINRAVTAIERKGAAEPVPAPAPAYAEKPAAEKAAEPAPEQHATYGGELLLYDVDDKTAACIMAIVSDQTKIPLNQLIFRSIRALD